MLRLQPLQGALTLLTGYQTPAAIRRLGAARLERWLSARKTRNARTLAQRAVEAATSQQITLPGEALSAQIVRTLAQQVLECMPRSARSTSSLRPGSISTPARPSSKASPGLARCSVRNF